MNQTQKSCWIKPNATTADISAVNLCNRHTIEFRLFRGTLNLETLYATLQLVDKICFLADNLTESELMSFSWSDFVSTIKDTEQINYLKLRQHYVNDDYYVEKDL